LSDVIVGRVDEIILLRRRANKSQPSRCDIFPLAALYRFCGDQGARQEVSGARRGLRHEGGGAGRGKKERGQADEVGSDAILGGGGRQA
jgi:hypothetical protein